MRYFRVDHAKGAFHEDYHYAEGEIVPMEDYPKDRPIPMWATEVDGPDWQTAKVIKTQNPGAIADKQAKALAEKVSGQKINEPEPETEPENTEDETPEEGAASDDKEAGDRERQIETALQLLEKDDDSHWTKDGLPNLNVIKETVGFQVTRAEMNKIAPEFKREDVK